MKQSVAVIICAAGKGFRAGFEKNKLLMPLRGERVLKKTLSAFDYSAIDEIIVTSSKSDFDEITALCSAYPKAKVVLGGETRFQSVHNGLQAVSSEIVLIHDGVRPFITEEIIDLSVDTAMEMGGCVAGVPAKDTIKVCDPENIAVATPDRSTLWQIQTPQTFRKDLILKAYEEAKKQGFVGTDDASLAEHSGYPVKVIMGSYRNIKITTKEDLLIGEAFLKEEQA
jgi:2-C-methyl-D-erythritol 4-phosphate cytidylyltransferase